MSSRCSDCAWPGWRGAPQDLRLPPHSSAPGWVWHTPWSCFSWWPLASWARGPQARLGQAGSSLGGPSPRAGPVGGLGGPMGSLKHQNETRNLRESRRFLITNATPGWFFLTGERVCAGQDVPPVGKRALHQCTGDRYGRAGAEWGVVCQCRTRRGERRVRALSRVAVISK